MTELVLAGTETASGILEEYAELRTNHELGQCACMETDEDGVELHCIYGEFELRAPGEVDDPLRHLLPLLDDPAVCDLDTARRLALAEFLKVSPLEIEEDGYCGEAFNCNGEQYRVLTDIEADEQYSSDIDEAYESQVLYEVPKHLHDYINEEDWRFDYSNDNTRGQVLAWYDGCEYENRWAGTDFYIYRTK